MNKELYIAELERIMAELEDQGMDSKRAYELAGDRAYDAMRDRLADHADNLRKRAKGE
jgi:hypothetical protein